MAEVGKLTTRKGGDHTNGFDLSIFRKEKDHKKNPPRSRKMSVSDADPKGIDPMYVELPHTFVSYTRNPLKENGGK